MTGVIALQILIWFFLAAFTVWTLGPVVGFFWKRQQIGIDVYAEPPLARPYPEDADGLRRYQELLDLGYAPAGSTYEHARFFTPLHWRWRSRGLRWLASPDGRTFVHLHRIVDEEPVRFGAVTVFEGGGTWHTACPGVQGEMPEIPGHGRADLIGVGTGELLEKHAAFVEAFARDNAVAAKSVGLAEVAQASLTYSRVALPRMKLGGLAALPVSMWALAVVPAVTSFARSGRARVVALAMAAFMALFYLAIRHGALGLAKIYTARRSHTRAFALERTAVAADGTIAVGRYERWLRVLAVVGALDVIARLVVVAARAAQDQGLGTAQLVFAGAVAVMCVMGLRELVARVKGRVASVGVKQTSVMAWSTWSTAAIIFTVCFKNVTKVHIGWLLAAFALSVLARELEKRGRM
jgi:hypothetical protein